MRNPDDPYALRVGFDYHLAEVKHIASARYQAQDRACGWVGQIRTTRSAAEDDCLAHDVTHNQ